MQFSCKEMIVGQVIKSKEYIYTNIFVRYNSKSIRTKQTSKPLLNYIIETNTKNQIK